MYSRGEAGELGNPWHTVHVEVRGMRHIKSVAQPRDIRGIPGLAQSPLEAKMQFLVDLTDRIIKIIMQKASGL